MHIVTKSMQYYENFLDGQKQEEIKLMLMSSPAGTSSIRPTIGVLSTFHQSTVEQPPPQGSQSKEPRIS